MNRITPTFIVEPFYLKKCLMLYIALHDIIQLQFYVKNFEENFIFSVVNGKKSVVYK